MRAELVRVRETHNNKTYISYNDYEDPNGPFTIMMSWGGK